MWDCIAALERKIVQEEAKEKKDDERMRAREVDCIDYSNREQAGGGWRRPCWFFWHGRWGFWKR